MPLTEALAKQMPDRSADEWRRVVAGLRSIVFAHGAVSEPLLFTWREDGSATINGGLGRLLVEQAHAASELDALRQAWDRHALGDVVSERSGNLYAELLQLLKVDLSTPARGAHDLYATAHRIVPGPSGLQMVIGNLKFGLTLFASAVHCRRFRFGSNRNAACRSTWSDLSCLRGAANCFVRPHDRSSRHSPSSRLSLCVETFLLFREFWPLLASDNLAVAVHEQYLVSARRESPAEVSEADCVPQKRELRVIVYR
jgi:hypothetical protein